MIIRVLGASFGQHCTFICEKLAIMCNYRQNYLQY